MTCRDDVGTTGPDKSESKRYLLVPNCFLGSAVGMIATYVDVKIKMIFFIFLINYKLKFKRVMKN